MRRTILIYLVVVLLGAFVSCKSPDAAYARAEFAGELLIEYGGSNICRTALSPTGRIVCGQLGAVSEITWKFIDRRAERDIYAFERRFPFGSRGENTIKRNVEYTGEREVVFYDDLQIISIGPKSAEGVGAAMR